MATHNKEYLVVAAIDFGTTYSGYAFSPRADFLKDPLKVCTNIWTDGKLLSSKTSTCVLFDKSKKFHSFGFEAEDKYYSLADENEHGDYYFFRRFKMKLFDKMQLKREFMLEEEMGKKMHAMEVFSACIQYLKDHLLKSVFAKDQVCDVPTILMVGEFSESPMLQDYIRQRMSDKKIIIPSDPGLAVLKGAVIFGYDPSAIQQRCCRYTYGVRISLPFKEGIHLESKKFVDDDGDILCSDIFDRHVKIGQPVEYGESQVTKYSLNCTNDHLG